MAYNKIVYGGNTLIDLTEDNVTASDVLSGKTFHGRDGEETVGSMVNRGAVTGTIATKTGTYAIQQGYHNGSGTVGISSVEQAKIIADNIKSGVTILGVAGSYAGEDVRLQSKNKTYTPTTSQQTETVTSDSGYDGLSSVNITVNAMPSGTINNPTATKGTVSNHSITVTPSVTNTAGYVAAGTKNGTAVTVTASELVSDEMFIDENGYFDITNYEGVRVKIPYYLGVQLTESGTAPNISFTPSVSYATAKSVLSDGGVLCLTDHNHENQDKFGYTDLGDSFIITYYDIDAQETPRMYVFTWTASGMTLSYVEDLIEKPTQTLSITTNGTHNVLNYASATVNVQPSLQSKSATPAVSAQTITADSGYYGLSSVAVGAIPYVETQNTYGITVTIG